MAILRFFTTDANDEAHRLRILVFLQNISRDVIGLQIERCYHVETSAPLVGDTKAESILRWLLKHPQNCSDTLRSQSTLPVTDVSTVLIEIGPRFSFCTAFSTNCVMICQNVGLRMVKRVEMSLRYLITFSGEVKDAEVARLVDFLGDRMTECRYTTDNLPVESFNEQLPKTNESWYHVPVMREGRQALQEVNTKLGLAFGNWDLDYYTNLFGDVLKRDPTTVELFDCAQSNSEHSRHWFFRGRMIIDGVEQPQSLIRMIMATQEHTNPNNTIKFSDNSSAMRGFMHGALRPERCDGPAQMALQTVQSDLIFTAETHNMPTAVSPFSGAATGTGGRLRDVQGVGRGGLPIAGTAGYCVGCLNIPGYPLPYEDDDFYPESFARPLKILLDASSGASDYGNKFGEPVIAGFVTAYGLINWRGGRDEFVKPIMFSGGLGTMEASMREKIEPQKGMLLAKIGGPVYRIGVGGGAASSREVQGSNDSDLDYNAVQRGDAEMENKLNRVVRGCVEMGDKNPILAIHDQGAGGNGNVLKELVEPGFAGAVIFSQEFQLGDPTINALELWGAEYQENNAILCLPEDRDLLESICARERCPISFVGVVTGNGRVTLIDGPGDFDRALLTTDVKELGDVPFDLELQHVLGEMPKREYHLERIEEELQPLFLDPALDYSESLQLVFSIVAVGSKRFLTNKVDRCVSGLVAQQQCVGPLHTPLADYGLVTVSHFATKGIATSIGTSPIKTLLDPASMARMCVAEALSNLVFVQISQLADVKCSGNWMWAAKERGEGAKMYDACTAMCEMMSELRIAVDGGKDSLSMAANVDGETIKSPGTLVISTYAPCPDVKLRITPDLKGPAHGIPSSLLWINIEGRFRLGASALAQAYLQQGAECPTVMCTDVLRRAFDVTQKLIGQQRLLAGHDISDGGLLVCFMEMAMSGLAGIHVNVGNAVAQLQEGAVDGAAADIGRPDLALLYAEECGWVLEVETAQLSLVQAVFSADNVPNIVIGETRGYGLMADIEVYCANLKLIETDVRTMLKQWERTSHELEKMQANIDCAIEEYNTLDYRTGPRYKYTAPLGDEMALLRATAPVRVAVLREEGVNSDRELMACLWKAHFEVHDVTMSDLLSARTSLDLYRGLIFPGGFSYADTLGSAKGWAANIMFSDALAPQFAAFKRRKEVFSLGICNGCQLMSLIGWIGGEDGPDTELSGYQPKPITVPDVALVNNRSERFECRWSTVRIEASNALMFRRLSGSILGCWVAHAEGKFSFRRQDVLDRLNSKNCIALRYVDDRGIPTQTYPMNPNGSVGGIAGICSVDGRHLALMPHPERCASMFQWPYVPPGFEVDTEHSPWQLMFEDAYIWCNSI